MTTTIWSTPIPGAALAVTLEMIPCATDLATADALTASVDRSRLVALVLHEPPTTKRYLLLRQPFTLLGRATIPHSMVSRRHARLSWEEDGLYLDDLNSTNGTFVNGRRVHAPVRLQHNDTVRLGPVEMTFLLLGPAWPLLPAAGMIDSPGRH